MEKIRLNEQIFNLAPMGIKTTEKKRSFTFTSELSFSEIETAFTNVSNIQYLSDIDEILAIYSDGVSVKSISKDVENRTYTVEISVDAVERKIETSEVQRKSLQEQIDEIMVVVVPELIDMILMTGGEV